MSLSLHLDLGEGLDPSAASDLAAARQTVDAAVADLGLTPPGFIEILSDSVAAIERCREEAKTLARYERVVILGIGGSALGARTILDALAPEQSDRLWILDNIDPATIESTAAELDPKKTAFLVVSKSGSTAETAAQSLYFRDWLLQGGGDPKEQMTLITDPSAGPLREIANREGFRTLEIPSRVGGRFSVLTPVGLLPAAILGVDPAPLVEGGRRLWEAVATNADHPLRDWVARGAVRAAQDGQTIQVVMSYCDRLRTLGDWFAQLWGESLGKRLDRQGAVVHRGSTPLAAVGATDQHSLVQLFVEGPSDKQFLILGTEPNDAPRAPIRAEAAEWDAAFSYLGDTSLDALFEAERVGTIQALRAAERPVSVLQIGDVTAESLGAMFLFFELATVLTAAILDVDPYDQPGVEGGKIIAFARMGREGYAEKAQALTGGAGDLDRGASLI